jgi:hypothetical protein
MPYFILSCSLTIAAAGKINMGNGCWFYDSEMPNYISVKTPKDFPGLALSASLLQNTRQSGASFCKLSDVSTRYISIHTCSAVPAL